MTTSNGQELHGAHAAAFDSGVRSERRRVLRICREYVARCVNLGAGGGNEAGSTESYYAKARAVEEVCDHIAESGAREEARIESDIDDDEGVDPEELALLFGEKPCRIVRGEAVLGGQGRSESEVVSSAITVLVCLVIGAAIAVVVLLTLSP